MRTIPHDIDFTKYIDFVGSQESQFFLAPSTLIEDVVDLINGGVDAGGYVLPWMKTHDNVSIRLGEISIWAGINGHGKSQILGQVLAWMLPYSRSLIASLEMKPAATMRRMVRQVSGCPKPTEWYVAQFLSWTDDRLWIYDQLDTVAPERILGMIAYAVKELGIEQIVIDSLMKCGIGNDDYRGQKEFVDKLAWLAKTLNCHIHLVHHMRKGHSENDLPDKFDVRGAGEIVDLVDNLFIVWRNKGKEADVQAGKEVEDYIPDAALVVGKQRHGEWEGKINLWFDKGSQQYTPTKQNRPMPYNFMEAS